MERQSEQQPSMDGTSGKNAALDADKEAKTSRRRKMTKSELGKVYADAETRVRVLERSDKKLRSDVETIELAFAEGQLTLDEFLGDIRFKQKNLDDVAVAQRPLFHALYVIGKELEEAGVNPVFWEIVSNDERYEVVAEDSVTYLINKKTGKCGRKYPDIIKAANIVDLMRGDEGVDVELRIYPSGKRYKRVGL